jgi:hypothetical protein
MKEELLERVSPSTIRDDTGVTDLSIYPATALLA